MSRRHQPKPDHGRDSIGHVQVENAVTALNRTCATAVAVMTTYEFTREATLPMLFRDDDLEKLRQVRGMVTPMSTIQAYDLGPNVTLGINYDGALVPTVTRERLAIYPERVLPLAAYIAEVKAIHEKFEEVKAVLRWLNRNATPGAIRYYWPTALQLCPHSTAFRDLQQVPTRYDVPRGISDWLPSIRDAAVTVAGSLLLPNTATPRIRNTMWLNFGPYRIHPSLENAYTTDAMTYYI